MLTGNNPPPPHHHEGALQPQAARRAHRQHRRNGVTETPLEHQLPPGRDATTYPPEHPAEFSSSTAERSSPGSCSRESSYLMLAFISSMFTSTGQPLTLIALPWPVWWMSNTDWMAA